MDTGAVREYTYAIGSDLLRLRFAGDALIPLLTPALAHLAAPDPAATGGRTLTIDVWDSASTNGAIPPPGWDETERRGRSEIGGYDDPSGRIRAVYNGEAELVSLFDTATDTAILWSRDPQLLPVYEVAAPFKVILHWWLERTGRLLVHGGAIGTEAGGVLVIGRGGSGKSTTCLACLAAPETGLRYASDDYTIVTDSAPPAVHSLYASAKLHTNHLWRLPRLAPLAANPAGIDGGKAMLLLAERCPERLIRSFPIRALLLPRVVGGPVTRLRPMKAAEGLVALAPSTILQLPVSGAPALRAMARIAARVPGFVLELGDDTAQIPGVIAGWLAQDAPPARATGR
ncbi:MAG TPA: hypothetical protein VIL85_17545 [Thermomicrobiales bacterium]